MSESWHDYGFGICTSNLKEEISLPGLMELISQAPELKERVNTFMNNECGGAFKDSYDILTSYVEQYGIGRKRPLYKRYTIQFRFKIVKRKQLSICLREPRRRILLHV